VAGDEQGSFNNVEKGSTWAGYNKDRTVDKEMTGTFKDGVKISD